MNQLSDDEVKNYLKTLYDYSDSKEITFKRHVSYDFCYNYFQSFVNKEDIKNKNNMNLSCLQLGFYLASWGMHRGLSKQSLRSYKIYEDVIEVIANEKELWNVDVNDYSDQKTRNNIIKNKKEIETAICKNLYRLHLDDEVDDEIIVKKPKVSETLITKIMMGTFGCVPAFDTNFTKFLEQESIDTGSKNINYKMLNESTLLKIHSFYLRHKETIDNCQIKIYNDNCKKTENFYKKARLVDFIGFYKVYKDKKREAESKK